MKLYYTPGACSLSPHIVLHEIGSPFLVEKVDLRAKKTASGADYFAINPRGQVPLLELDNGVHIGEGSVIVQYLADKNPSLGLAPPVGTTERYKVLEWLSYTGSELHKSYAPLFRPTTPEEYKSQLRAALGTRLKMLNTHFASNDYVLGESFCIADAYMFTILRWSPSMGIDLTDHEHVGAYLARMNKRPAVQRALEAESA